MTARFASTAYTLTRIADTAGAFADFCPYVPSVSGDGSVAFQAALRRGGSGVFTGRGGAITAVVEPGGLLVDVESHPDVNDAGMACFYARSCADGRGVFAARGGEIIAVADNAGPLGPTMNDRGDIAFRANLDGGGEGVFLWRDGEVVMIARTCSADTSSPGTSGADERGTFSAFHGLPVINNRGAVCFRADLMSGVQSINVLDGPSRSTVVTTGSDFGGGVFSALNSFPTIDDAGTVAFCATLSTGASGAFAAHDGQIRTIADSTGRFESFRSALLDGAARAVLCATPRRGTLGVFVGPDPQSDRLIAIGDPLHDSTITDFALNPVSINGPGQIAIRVKLADGRQVILRADPIDLNRGH